MEEGLRNILSVIILKGKCDRSSVVKPKFSREVAIIFSLELQSAFSDSIHFRLWRSITQRINYIIPNQHNWIWYRAITDTPQNIQNSASLSVMFAICQIKERNLIKLLAGMLLTKNVVSAAWVDKVVVFSGNWFFMRKRICCMN